MSKTFKIVGNDMSDGYHTFDELYEHRCLIFINLCLLLAPNSVWKVDPKFPGWPCLYLESYCGQISYHVPEKYKFLFEERIKRDDSHKWDGHTSDTVLERLNLMAR